MSPAPSDLHRPLATKTAEDFVIQLAGFRGGFAGQPLRLFVNPQYNRGTSPARGNGC